MLAGKMNTTRERNGANNPKSAQRSENPNTSTMKGKFLRGEKIREGRIAGKRPQFVLMARRKELTIGQKSSWAF